MAKNELIGFSKCEIFIGMFSQRCYMVFRMRIQGKIILLRFTRFPQVISVKNSERLGEEFKSCRS
jgi:hypothetical protein